jgi:stage IV sporulation protein FB
MITKNDCLTILVSLEDRGINIDQQMKKLLTAVAILLALTFLLRPTALSLCTLLAALIHELGHVAMARLCRIQLRECKIGIFGAGLVPDGSLYSYGQEILLCLAGPLCNLTCASLGLWLLPRYSAFGTPFVFASLALGLLNLLPIQGFDGGRILHALLSLLLPPHTARGITTVSSFFCVLTLWIASTYLLLRAAASLSLFVFSLSLFCRIFLSEE